MIGLHVTTLGCKLNQFDSAELAGSLRGAAALVGEPADARLVVVNTCTVTAAADSEARQVLRRRRRESPGALIVATGCFAERDPEALRAMPEVDLVLRREDRPRAARLILAELGRRFPDDLSDGCAQRVVKEGLPDFGGRTRAYLRVQEGCDLRCSYCVIPKVRGASRSLPPAEVLSRFRRLVEAGYREVVLTGVNTGEYGKDLDPRSDLSELLERLLRLDGDFRIRLNSVEPRRVTSRLIDLMDSAEKLARHLQVPLQSGSDAILGAMRRNYRTRHYLRLLERLRSRVPDMGLGADVIVGFPGEGEREFLETLRFIGSSPLNYLHVFPYSIRPGTPAAAMPGQVPSAAVKERSRALRELGRKLSLSFRRLQAGRPLRALVLGEPAQGAEESGVASRALTSNFIEVAVAGRHPRNTFLDVIITHVGEEGNARAVPSGQAALAGA